MTLGSQKEARTDSSRSSLVPICIVLSVMTLAAYGRIWGLGFINMDDPPYVAANPKVLAGLGWSGLAWAFTTTSQANWHPLTWLSLMLDATLGGAGPRVYHATNLLLHLANTLLLFLVLERMTGRRYRCAFVAALFGVHPLHVESVAWISERKDVLSMFFALLTIAAYVRYAARRSPAAYAAVVVALAAGLLAKPMLVTLPLLLLLLDYWPLARMETAGTRTLLLEKMPLFVLAGISAVVTLIVQKPAMERMEGVALGARVANALVSYVVYVGKMFWPSGLAIFYPFPRGLSWQPIGAAVLLALASFVAIRLGRARPFVPVGWFWYVVTLVPVSGIVQVGLQARADRYTYLPHVGLFIVVVWGVASFVDHDAPQALARRVLAAAGGALLLVLGSLTFIQVGYWRDGVALFTHAIDVTGDNVLAQFNLADAYDARGDEELAILHLREAVRIDPRFPDSHFNLQSALIRQRKLDEAEALCRQAQEFWPTSERTLVNLGIVELLRGNFDEAAKRLEEALRLYPDSAVARHNLAVARAGQAKAGNGGR